LYIVLVSIYKLKQTCYIIYEPFELIDLKFTFKKAAHPDNSTGISASDRGREKVILADDTQKVYPRSDVKVVQRADVMIAEAIMLIGLELSSI